MSSRPSSDPIRTLLIGRGKWGANFEKCIKSSAAFHLAAICGRDWRKAIDSTEYEAAIIATPPDTHFEILSEMLTREMPCIVEKPLTLDLAQALELEKLHLRHPVPVIVDHIHLFSEAYQTLKTQLDEKHATILSLRSMGCGQGPFRDYSALWDYGPHDLAMALDLAGSRPLAVTSRAVANRREAFKIDLRFTGFTAKLEFGSGYEKKTRFLEVITDQGTWIYDDLASAKLTHDGKAVPLSGASPMEGLLEYFEKGIRHGKPSPSALSLGVQIIRVLDQVTDSTV